MLGVLSFLESYAPQLGMGGLTVFGRICTAWVWVTLGRWWLSWWLRISWTPADVYARRRAALRRAFRRGLGEA